METAFFLLMGWCGTKCPGWWRFPVPPHPDPEPWWKYGMLGLGLIAGVAGGVLFSNAIVENPFFAGQNAIASGLVAFGASSVVTGIVSGLKR